MPGHKAEDGWPTLNMNGWEGAPYVFDERLHPTARLNHCLDLL